jgi:AraC-like DNA-binding protein
MPNNHTSSANVSLLVPEALSGARLLQFHGASRLHSYYNNVYSIVAVFRSAADVSFRGRMHSAKGGDVGLLAPDGIFRHVTNPIPEQVGKLHIDQGVVDHAARELGVRHGEVQFKTLLVRAPELFDALAELHECARREHAPLEIQSKFVSCLRLIVEQRDGGMSRVQKEVDNRSVLKARDFLHAHFTERITLNGLAQASGVSVYQLPRIFTKIMGVPPHQYQTHLRLAEARRLLGLGAPVSNVAIDVGFIDQSHLTRHFRRALGFTPGAYVTGQERRSAHRRARPLVTPATKRDESGWDWSTTTVSKPASDSHSR